MSITEYRFYEFRKFELGELKVSFQTILDKFSTSFEDANFSLRYEYGETSESKNITIEDLGTILEIGDKLDSVILSFRTESYGRNYISISKRKNLLHIYSDSPSAETTATLLQVLEESLKLKRLSPPIEDDDEIDEIKKRLLFIEQQIGQKDRQLTCFFSYRFNDYTKPLALELIRFLELAGVQVISGAGYEPRKLSDKVMSRLEQPMDFFIYLVSGDGESTWTRDELGIAHVKGYAVVLLVEKGAKIEKGILGDWEYLEFVPGHISDTFVGIMEAIRYIRREKIEKTELKDSDINYEDQT